MLSLEAHCLCRKLGYGKWLAFFLFNFGVLAFCSRNHVVYNASLFFFLLSSTEQDARRRGRLFSTKSHHMSSHIYCIHGSHPSVIEGTGARHFSSRNWGLPPHSTTARLWPFKVPHHVVRLRTPFSCPSIASFGMMTSQTGAVHTISILLGARLLVQSAFRVCALLFRPVTDGCFPCVAFHSVLSCGKTCTKVNVPGRSPMGVPWQ